MAEVTPEEATTAFLDAMKASDEQVYESYMDNQYVNALANADLACDKLDEAESSISESVFENLEYELIDSIERNGLAVVKVKVKNTDFSDTKEDYDKASYKYVMENLYSKDIEDKDKLADECLSIYIDELNKAVEAAGENAKEKPDNKSDAGLAETELYIPLEADGYGGWRVLMDDEIMMGLMGGLELPVANDK